MYTLGFLSKFNTFSSLMLAYQSFSLKEFIEMSSIGEFKKRLQLLVAFHGHISTGLRNGTYSR